MSAHPVSNLLTINTPTKTNTKTTKGGTRFIGVYLARDLVAAGHEVTLLTRGKAPITQKLVTESDADYAAYKGAIKHVAADRKDYDGLKAKLSSMPFDGRRKGGWEGGGVGAESCWGRRENPHPHFPSLFPKVVYDLNGREAEEAAAERRRQDMRTPRHRRSRTSRRSSSVRAPKAAASRIASTR